MSAEIATNTVPATHQAQIDALHRDGFVIARGLIPPAQCAALRAQARAGLAAAAAPIELEADLQYPGAPASADAPGGRTVRRLLDAWGRDPVFAAAATDASIASWMRSYFGEEVLLSRTHHNCLMTKHPQYGSLTGWHRDARYWSFERDDLVSAWFAIGEERVDNGALWFIPGSHRVDLAADAFDTAKFFRADTEQNQALIATAVSPALNAGDVVFFHCNTLHSAGKNISDEVKFSLAFTYHGISNTPRTGTRSASRPEIALPRLTGG